MNKSKIGITGISVEVRFKKRRKMVEIREKNRLGRMHNNCKYLIFCVVLGILCSFSLIGNGEGMEKEVEKMKYGETILANGDFEKIDKAGKISEGWTFIPPQNGNGTLSIDKGRKDGYCAKITYTREVEGWGHGISQADTFGVKKGAWYEVKFLAKGEGAVLDKASVAVRNTKTWTNQLWINFAPSVKWKEFRFVFCATEDLSEDSVRLQFGFDAL